MSQLAEELRPPRVWPRGRGAGWFALAGFVNAVGTGFFYPFSLLFFHVTAQLPLTVVGIGLTLTTLLALPSMVWIGRLVDNIGPRRVLIAAGLLRAGAFAGFVTVRDLVGFLLFSTVVAVCNRAEHGATPVLATALASEGTTSSWLALSRTVLNAGIGLGALLGGLALVGDHTGFAVLGLANAASFLAAALLHLPLPEDRPPQRQDTQVTTKPWQDRHYRRLAISNALIWFVAIAIETGLPAYLITVRHQPPWTVGVLFTINTALLTLLHLPLAARLSAHNPLFVTALGTTLYCGLLGALGISGTTDLPTTLAILVATMAVYTLGELMTTQAMLVLLTTTAPPTERGTYLAFSQIFTGLATALAPIVVTTLLDHWPPALWWTLLAITGLVIVDTCVLRERLPTNR